MASDSPRPLERKTSLGYQVNHLARLLEHALRVRIEGFGVVPGQFAQLLALYEQDGLTQRELWEEVKVEQPTMAKTLHRMERDGLVYRVPDARDARRARVMLTERARRLEDDLAAAAHGVNDMATQDFTREEVVSLLDMLERLIHNLESQARAEKSNRETTSRGSTPTKYRSAPTDRHV